MKNWNTVALVINACPREFWYSIDHWRVTFVLSSLFKDAAIFVVFFCKSQEPLDFLTVSSDWILVLAPFPAVDNYTKTHTYLSTNTFFPNDQWLSRPINNTFYTRYVTHFGQPQRNKGPFQFHQIPGDLILRFGDPSLYPPGACSTVWSFAFVLHLVIKPSYTSWFSFDTGSAY